MENKVFDKDGDNYKANVGAYTDPMQIRNRMIKHVEFDIREIASSRFWKLVSYFRQIKAIVYNSSDNLLTKLKIASWATQELFSQNGKSLFDTGKLSLVVPCLEKQQSLYNQQVVPSSKIAVVVHLFYIDLWEEIEHYLQNIQHAFDLFVSIPTGNVQILAEIRKLYPKAYIYLCPNHGRDIAPFIEIISSIQECEYSYICKIHTKKSPHLSNGKKWRHALFDDLLGSEARVNNILCLFQNCLEVGMIVPEGYLYSALEISTVTNEKIIEYLCRTLGVVSPGVEFEYPAGSMFWCRADIFDLLAKSGIQTSNFQSERRQLNNTLAHAMERFFGILVLHDKKHIVETSVLPPD